jgi:hypothetical protein
MSVSSLDQDARGALFADLHRGRCFAMGGLVH